MNYKISLRIAIISILFVLSISEVSAQVVQKIGSNSFTINPKAVLELESTTKGFLPPRMTMAQQTAISLGASEKGLIVYVTDAPVPGLKIWDGSQWIAYADTAALALKAPLASPVFTGTVTGITSAMVGLGNVNNTTDLLKPISTATQTALDLKAPLASPTFTGTVSGITATMVGLGSVDNTTDLLKPISTATQTALDTKASNINLDLKAPLASPTFTGTVSGITATMVGLGSVDNTTDLLKPISTATQTALDTKSSTTDLALKAPLASPTFTGTVSGITATMVGLGSVDNTTDLLKPISTAAQTALDLKEDKSNKSTDVYTDRTSDIKYPSVKAVKTYVDVYSTFNAISTITASYTATISDYTILCNNNAGPFQLTLPTASTTSGKIYVIRKTDESANILTISPALKLTESTEISSLDWPKTMRVQSNGTNWYIIN